MTGAMKYTRLSASTGMMSSLKASFSPSARRCSQPPGPTRFGPGRCCIRPTTLRSQLIMNRVSTTPSANSATTLIRISQIGSSASSCCVGSCLLAGSRSSPPPGRRARHRAAARTPGLARVAGQPDHAVGQVGQRQRQRDRARSVRTVAGSPSTRPSRSAVAALQPHVRPGGRCRPARARPPAASRRRSAGARWPAPPARSPGAAARPPAPSGRGGGAPTAAEPGQLAGRGGRGLGEQVDVHLDGQGVQHPAVRAAPRWRPAPGRTRGAGPPSCGSCRSAARPGRPAAPRRPAR